MSMSGREKLELGSKVVLYCIWYKTNLEKRGTVVGKVMTVSNKAGERISPELLQSKELLFSVLGFRLKLVMICSP